MASNPTNVDLISPSQANKEVTANGLFDAGSPALAYGRRQAGCGGLVWAYFGATWSVSDVPTVIPNGTLTLTASSTCYIRRKQSDGTVDFVTSEPTDWPKSNGGYDALYDVTTGASTVNPDWNDWRQSGAGGGSGSQGAQGAAGAQGIAGAQGPQGDTGGPQGQQGAAGAQGAQGNQGTQGSQGSQGNQGTQGTAGSVGGSTTQIQYNASGAFAGDSRLTFDATNKVTKGQFSSDSGAINAQTGTTYTLQASDNGKIITLSNASAIVVTVPSGLGAGFSCMCVQIGAGQVSFTASSTTINPSSTLKIAAQYGIGTLYAYASDVFVLAGNISA